MSFFNRIQASALVCAALTTACARVPGRRTEYDGALPEPAPTTIIAVEVHNDRHDDIELFLIGPGIRRHLEWVPSLSTRVLFVDRNSLPRDGCIQMRARVLAGPSWLSDPFCVRGRGERVMVSVEPIIATSSAWPRR
jgi:hypothetical protein